MKRPGSSGLEHRAERNISRMLQCRGASGLLILVRQLFCRVTDEFERKRFGVGEFETALRAPIGCQAGEQHIRPLKRRINADVLVEGSEVEKSATDPEGGHPIGDTANSQRNAAFHLGRDPIEALSHFGWCRSKMRSEDRSVQTAISASGPALPRHMLVTPSASATSSAHIQSIAAFYPLSGASSAHRSRHRRNVPPLASRSRQLRASAISAATRTAAN